MYDVSVLATMLVLCVTVIYVYRANCSNNDYVYVVCSNYVWIMCQSLDLTIHKRVELR